MPDEHEPLRRTELTGLRLWALVSVIVWVAFMAHPARAGFYQRAWLFVQQHTAQR